MEFTIIIICFFEVQSLSVRLNSPCNIVHNFLSEVTAQWVCHHDSTVYLAFYVETNWFETCKEPAINYWQEREKEGEGIFPL